MLDESAPTRNHVGTELDRAQKVCDCLWNPRPQGFVCDLAVAEALPHALENERTQPQDSPQRISFHLWQQAREERKLHRRQYPSLFSYSLLPQEKDFR